MDDHGEHNGAIFAHPARVLATSFTPAERLMDLAAERAFDPQFVREANPFFWAAEISNNRLDAYFTKMASSSLRNYAVDAADGVSFQNSHEFRRLGFGRSLTGTFEETGTIEVDERVGEFQMARVIAEFYTIPGLRLHDVGTDDFIAGVRSSLIHDVSIGFYGGKPVCSLCGRSLYDWECPHIPGLTYPKRGPNGDVVAEELAFAWMEGAHLAEVSAVYDGATPGAAIMKAQQEADGGRLKPAAARLIEARYRIRLTGAQQIWTAGTPAQGGNMGENDSQIGNERSAAAAEPQAEERLGTATAPAVPVPGTGEGNTPADAEAQMVALRATLAGLGLPEGDLPAQVRGLADETLRLRPLEVRLAEAERMLVESTGALDAAQVELARLRPLAADGETYRSDLLSEALEEGVRAVGSGFRSDTYRALLEKSDLATIKQFRDDWRGSAEKLFPGGRQSTDAGEQGPKADKTVQPQATPDAAFAA